MSASQRTKGAVAERAVVTLLREHGWPEAERTSNGRHQRGRSDITGIPGVAIEVKRQERLNVPAALDQLLEDCDPSDIPVLVHRPSHHEWMATLPLADLLPLLKLREL